MQITTISEARKNLTRYLDDSVDNVEPVFISRGQDRDAVIISKNVYDNLIENAYLNASKNNRERLNESIRRLNASMGSHHDLIEG